MNDYLSKASRRLVAILLLGLALHAAPAPAGQTARDGVQELVVGGGRFGPVHVYRPGHILGVALFFSGDGGWQGRVIDQARRLAGDGYLVGGVDIRRYLSSIEPKAGANAGQESCVSLAVDVEGLSQHLQRTLGLPNYRRPALFGYSAGAAMVYATLAQAPKGVFTSGVSLGFCPEMDFAGARLCPGEGLRYQPLRRAGAAPDEIVMTPDPKLSYPWIVVHGDHDNVCGAPAAKAFTKAIPSSKLIALPDAGHELQGSDAWWPRLRQQYGAIPTEDAATAVPDALQDLPLAEVPAGSGKSEYLAVMITGDGGWASLDQELSAALSARGVPVTALNSLKYFWKARSPEQTALDVSRIIEQYTARWGKTRVLLIGYSFGADVMPLVYNRLPATSRARVASINLLGLGAEATFEITAGEWLPGFGKKGVPVLPEVRQFGATPSLCIEGANEKDTQCPEVGKLGVEVRQIGEGHHFSGLVGDIANAILELATRTHPVT